MSVRTPRRLASPATLRLLASATPRLRVLVATMLVFNTGFYLVLPFLADHLTEGLGLAAGVVGAVLGLRMLAQQGLFVIGGALADRIGERRAVLAGTALRVLGFVLLAEADRLVTLVGAVLLVGVAGALFTPAVEALVAREAELLTRAGTASRTEVFALYSAAGQVGTLVGPALGALALVGGFRWVCLGAAIVFAFAYVALRRALPPDRAGAAAPATSWSLVLGNRRFLVLAAGLGGYLAVYNQLYLAVPLELARGGRPAAVAGWLFTGSAALVVLLQVPVGARLAGRLGTHRAVPVGFVLLGLGAAAPAVLGPTAALTSTAAFVLLLTLGQMLLLPASRDAVAQLARDRMLATHFGVVGTAGGVAVLLLGVMVGRAFDAAARGDAPGALPWLLVVAVALASAATTGWALRTPAAPPDSSDPRPVRHDSPELTPESTPESTSETTPATTPRRRSTHGAQTHPHPVPPDRGPGDRSPAQRLRRHRQHRR